MLDFIKNIGAIVGGWINVDSPLLVGGAVLGLGALILLIIVIGICVSSSKKKKAKREAVKKAEKDRLAKEKIQAEIEAKKAQEQAQAEQVKEERKAEPIVVQEEVKTEPKKQASALKKTATKKPEPKKAETKKKEQPKTEKPVKKLLGKWAVEIKGEKEYIACLFASNGEIMLSSETYSTEEGARGGIETIIKGVETGKFVIYQDKNKNNYYKLKSANNRLLCVGEIYKSEEQCLKAVESVKRIAKDSPVVSEVIEGAKYVEYKPAKLDEETLKKGLKGKWKIESTASGNFSAKLFASNGQLMLATEEVAIRKNAEKAIESVSKNAIAGNFIIDKDKFGRFYYKLRTAQKSVICIGEAYESLDSCISAIESVRRFASNAVVVED